ncbi:hypothetical protein IGJ02_003084 [Enterococcus sp. DIV0724b]
MIEKRMVNKKCIWVNFQSENVNSEPLIDFCKEYDINKKVITYAMDSSEQARLDIYSKESTLVLVFKVLNQKKTTDTTNETIPITFILRGDYVITITNKDNHYVYEQMKDCLDKCAKKEILSTTSFLFITLFELIDDYFPRIESINKTLKEMDSVSQKDNQSNLETLSDLQKRTIYLYSAAVQNNLVLEKMKELPLYNKLPEDEKEDFNASLAESSQLVSIIDLSNQISQNMSDTYNNYFNNNLNNVMKILTVWSLILTIPAIVTGFFGMNIKLPTESGGKSIGWTFTLILIVSLSFLMSVLIKKILK